MDLPEAGLTRSGVGAAWTDGTRRLRPPEPATSTELATWRTEARHRLRALLGLPTEPAPGELIIDGESATGSPTEPIMITLTTGGSEIPCWLLAPEPELRLDVAVIAVAGHGPGIDALVDPSPASGDYHGGLAQKLVRAGFTVLCPEMVSFGRRRTPSPDVGPAPESSCQVDAMRGLLTGRPVLGARVADTLAAVRALRASDVISTDRVAVVGGSGGGAVALIAAALDEGIDATIVATYLSSFASSLGAVPHCICNAVPDLLTWFEMADVAALVAPRPLIIEAGHQDPIFPIAATVSAQAEMVGAWRSVGAPPPELVITDAGHQFLADASIAALRDTFRLG